MLSTSGGIQGATQAGKGLQGKRGPKVTAEAKASTALARVVSTRGRRFGRVSPEQILTPKEVEQLVAAAPSLRDRALILVLYETGCRASEACALKLRHVARTNDHFEVWFEKVKGGEQKHFAFIVEGAGLLGKWLEAHPFREDPEAPLFPSISGNHLEHVGLWSIIKRVGRRAFPGRRIWPHQLRHSRVSHLLALGAKEATVKELMGWTPNSPMIGRYAHFRKADTKRGYFEALGRKAPEEVKLERPDFNDPRLGAVKPMLPGPVHRPTSPAPGPQLILAEAAAHGYCLLETDHGFKVLVHETELERILKNRKEAVSPPLSPEKGPRAGSKREAPTAGP
jgi:hypothetical protein